MKKSAFASVFVSAMVLSVSCSSGATSLDKSFGKKSADESANTPERIGDLQNLVQRVISEIKAGNDPVAYSWSFCEEQNDKTYCVASALAFANGKTLNIENRGNYGETSAQSVYSAFKEDEGEKVAAKFPGACWAKALEEAVAKGANPDTFSQMFTEGNVFFTFGTFGAAGFDLKTGVCYTSWDR